MAGPEFPTSGDSRCEGDRASLAQEVSFRLLGLNNVFRSGDDFKLSSRPQPAVLKMEPCPGTTPFDTNQVTALMNRDRWAASGDIILAKGAGNWPAVDYRTPQQKFDDLNGDVSREMQLLRAGSPSPGIHSGKDVFNLYVDQVVKLTKEEDSTFSSHWKDYHERYMQMKDSLVRPRHNMDVFIADARKLVPSLPQSEQPDVNAALDEIAKFPDTDSGTTRYWVDKLPQDDQWMTVRLGLEEVDPGEYATVPVWQFRRLRTELQNDVRLMRDLRNYSRPFLEAAGRDQEKEQAARQERLLQFTFDNFPTAQLLESPVPKLRHSNANGFPEVDFWN
jgi:hypothetical protein